MTTKEQLTRACRILRGEIPFGESANNDAICLLRYVRSAIEDGEKVSCSGRDLWALIDEVIEEDKADEPRNS
jgi:hypothetical protein